MDVVEEIFILLLTRATFFDKGYWFSIEDFNEVLGRVQVLMLYGSKKNQFTSAAGQ